MPNRIISYLTGRHRALPPTIRYPTLPHHIEPKLTGNNPNSPGNKAKVKTIDSLKKAGWASDVNSVKRKPGTDSVSIGFYKKGGKSIPITPKKK